MRRRVYGTLVAVCFMLSGYYVLQYQHEQVWLATKAKEIVQAAHVSLPEERVLALRDYLRDHIRGEGLAIEGRPFLRATAKEVLETGQGFCGEATRAFIALARHLGISAHRINLYGTMAHVVAEAAIMPGKWVLVDGQDNPTANGFLDQKWWTLDEAIVSAGSPFTDYSYFNMRRAPVVNLVVQRVKLYSGWVSWMLENPPLIKAGLSAVLAGLLAGLWFLDRLLWTNSTPHESPCKPRVSESTNASNA